MTEEQNWPQIVEWQERRFLAGPRSRRRELLTVVRVATEFISGFRRLHFVGPAVTVFGSARRRGRWPTRKPGNWAQR